MAVTVIDTPASGLPSVLTTRPVTGLSFTSRNVMSLLSLTSFHSTQSIAWPGANAPRYRRGNRDWDFSETRNEPASPDCPSDNRPTSAIDRGSAFNSVSVNSLAPGTGLPFASTTRPETATSLPPTGPFCFGFSLLAGTAFSGGAAGGVGFRPKPKPRAATAT